MRTPPGTTNTWGKRSAHVLAIAPGAVLMVALAGCSLGNPTLNEPAPLPANEADAGTQPPTTSSDERPAFHFASGDLVLGDFTYEDVAGNIFNPCEEISAEEFAAIGFETEGDVKRREFGDINACPITSDSSPVGLNEMVLGGSANIEAVKAKGGVETEDASSVVPDVYTYGAVTGEDICFAAVDTNRGQLSVATGGIESTYDQETRCSRAIELLEKLFR